MFKETDAVSRFVVCPHCGLSQSVTFVYNAVSVEQRCIGCDRCVWFRLPSLYLKLAAWLGRRRSGY
jgi:hypothetical protein